MEELLKQVEQAEEMLQRAVRGKTDLMLLAQQNLAMWQIALQLAKIQLTLDVALDRLSGPMFHG